MSAPRTTQGTTRRTTPVIPAPGFAEPTRDAQRAFRAVLDALAHPTRSYPLAGPAQAPAALGPGLAAVLLTLLDEECTLWLGGDLAADAETDAWLTFHTGTRRAPSAADADFVVTAPGDLPALAGLAQGTDQAPHASATVVLDVRGCTGSRRWTARGPGIEHTAELDAPWAADGFLDGWAANTAAFPRGVDLLLVDAGSLTALPRTTRLHAADQHRED